MKFTLKNVMLGVLMTLSLFGATAHELGSDGPYWPVVLPSLVVFGLIAMVNTNYKGEVR